MWVPGDYRDGRGANARFSSPEGIAVGRDGLVYVADTFNHRIRRIARDGTVSTFASVDLPVDLAFDRRGDLYVADRLHGVDRIGRDGTVTPVTMDARDPFGITILDDPSGPIVVAADTAGISVSSTAYGHARYNSERGNGGLLIEGDEPIGTPYHLTSIDARAIAYTDVRTHDIRYLDLQNGITAIIAGESAADRYSGAYRDARGNLARFNAPMGIARDTDGSLVVADAGNRALFRIVVETLGDLFEPRLCPVYADLFSEVIARRIPDLHAEHLVARYKRICRPRVDTERLPARR